MAAFQQKENGDGAHLQYSTQYFVGMFVVAELRGFAHGSRGARFLVCLLYWVVRTLFFFSL